MLQEMYAQHPFQTHWRPARAFRLRVKRLDRLAEVFPWDNLLHLIEKLFPTCWLAKLLKAFFGERSLPHSANLQWA